MTTQISSTPFQKLSEKFNQLELAFNKRTQNKQQRKRKHQQDQNDLIDELQQKTDTMISKIQQLKRKQTIIITMQKIQPSIPQNFPKNYFIQVTYEDVVVTGNQKYCDFDEDVIQQKFIIPLLTSSRAKIQIWTAQQQPVLFDKMQLNIERLIQECLLNGNKCNDEIQLIQCQGFKLTFMIHLQGIGFSAWLKNVNMLRELEMEKEIMKQQQRKRRDQTRQKLEQKKQNFNKKFNQASNKAQTKQYQNQEIDQILQILGNDD